MVELLFILIPILISDVINPVLFAGAVYALGTRHPYKNAFWVLSGFFVTYFTSGLLLGVVLEQILEYFRTPSTVDYVLAIFIAVGLIAFAWKLWSEQGEVHENTLHTPRRLSPLSAFWLGIQINFVGLPFALPYFAAIDQILMLDLPPLAGSGILLLYNIVYIAPFIGLLAIRKSTEKRCEKIFQKINKILWSICEIILPLFFLGIALFLLYQSACYFFFTQHQ